VSVKWEDAVVLAGPEVRELYSEAGDDLLDRAFFYEPLQRELGAKELIFRTTGQRHRDMRRCASLAFSRHVAAEHVPAAATEMVRRLRALDPGRRYDAVTLAGDTLLSAMGPMLAHRDLDPVVPDAGVYTRTMMEVAARTRTRFALFLPRYRGAKRRSMRFAHDLLDSWRRRPPGDTSATCILECLDQARDGRGDPFPDADLEALVLLAFVGAGVYINRVVGFMLYELFRDDDLRARVTAELDDACAGGFTYEGLRNARLLHAVYTEALRRYPIWFVVPFRAERDFVFDGRQVRRGEALLLSSVLEHFLPAFYTDPERFDVDRCLPPRSEHARRGAFAPFGAGVRRCIATGQTEILALLYVAVLIRTARFDADPAYDLRLRLKPLPAPHRFLLRYLGPREPPARTAPAPSPRSAEEQLSVVADRLVFEETQTFKAIVDREMHVRVFQAGTDVFQQGDPPDAFYLIESGQAVVRRTNDAGGEEVLARLGPGDVFGEIGLLRRQPRLATVTASPDGRLVALECAADAFERLLGDLNIVGEELIALIQRRKLTASLSRLLPAFGHDAILDLVPAATFRRGRSGDVFVREGDPADALYIIERGSFDVTVETPRGETRHLARLEAGEVFGEMGLLRNAPRSATVRVAADCDAAETLVIDKAAFLRMIEPRSAFREQLFAEVGRRAAELDAARGDRGDRAE
jgi:CRP-like cAMP-binding protein/cytochrome P450